MTAPRLFIVTNHPARAVLAVLGVEQCPSWCRVVTRVGEVINLPSGVKVIGQWFEPRKFRSGLEWAFIERRGRGDLLGLSLEDCARLAAWAERHGAETHIDSSLLPATGGMVISERRVGSADQSRVGDIDRAKPASATARPSQCEAPAGAPGGAAADAAREARP